MTSSDIITLLGDMKKELREDIAGVRDLLEGHIDESDKRLDDVEKFNWKVSVLCVAAIAVFEFGFKIYEAMAK